MSVECLKFSTEGWFMLDKELNRGLKEFDLD